MDISGRIRAVLEGVESPREERHVFSVMVRAVLGTLEESWTVDEPAENDEKGKQWWYDEFVQAGMLRIRSAQARPNPVGLERRMKSIQMSAEACVRREDAQPGELLWKHWLLTLGESLGGPANDRGLMQRLWEQGTVLQEIKAAATFHRLTPETLLDGFVYDELVAIHAAYNSAKVMGDEEKIERVRRAVRWHVENTQPDNATNEPWGLAAFAELDETGTFAEQQLHDAAVALGRGGENGRVPVAVGLLADAVMTMENW